MEHLHLNMIIHLLYSEYMLAQLAYRELKAMVFLLTGNSQHS